MLVLSFFELKSIGLLLDNSSLVTEGGAELSSSVATTETEAATIRSLANEPYLVRRSRYYTFVEHGPKTVLTITVLLFLGPWKDALARGLRPAVRIETGRRDGRVRVETLPRPLSHPVLAREDDARRWRRRRRSVEARATLRRSGE